ncbi:MAG: serine/threonine protein kinase [Planctomycetes bacterium]|nr:serine/threonine protein kinase [Planctomycetota bacterium]
MDDTFHRDYLVRLPLPLAQLYSRAHNAKQARARHDNAFYLCEALIKLAAAPAIVAYLNEASRGATRSDAVDGQLAHLTLPSLGHWLGLLRESARHFGNRVDAASHPLGHLWEQLSTRRREWDGVLSLFRRIKNGPDGQPTNVKGCSALELFDALVQYRNTVFGHGASRVASFYEKEMGPLLLPAVSDLLADGALDILGPKGSRLVFLAEIRATAGNRMELELRELVGRESERADAKTLTAEDAATLAPGCVAVEWPGQPVPLRLDPLLTFRETDLSEEVLFLNRDRSGRQVEYLSYTTGQTLRNREMQPSLERLLDQIPGLSKGPDSADQTDQVKTADDAPASPPASSGNGTAPSINDFQILAEVGRGGMGVVYLARQLSLGRMVALKTLTADLLGDEIALARFRREMRALGRCDHSNIVKVYSCGAMPDGQLYYAMEYVPGADLDRVWRELAGDKGRSDGTSTSWSAAVRSASQKQLEQTRETAGGSTAVNLVRPSTHSASSASAHSTICAPLAENELPHVAALPEDPDEEDVSAFQHRVAGLIHDAATALQAVHDQKIVHRDVKPANLILTADGSRVVLMDFGLAKGQSTALTSTRSGGLLGTLRYSAPEQLAAANMPIGPTADVRGLGVTMWELLTRQRLFGEADDERQLATWVLNRDVPLLRSVDPALAPDLEAITAKATERNVESRIQSAGQLAEYLELYLAGKPVPIGAPKAVEKILARFTIPIVILAALATNGLAGLFNFLYNRDEIIRHISTESLGIFWATQSVINAIAYPVGVFLVGMFAYKATRPLRRAYQQRVFSPDDLRRARRHSLLLGHYTAVIGIALWVLAGAAYPIAIHAAAGEMPPSAYLHFFGSLTLCGLVAAAYPFFLITWFSLRIIYPFLSRGNAYASEDRGLFQRLNRLSWRYFVCAAAVPMCAVATLATINTGSRLALGVFGFGGLLGFVLVAAIFRQLQSTLTSQSI